MVNGSQSLCFLAIAALAGSACGHDNGTPIPGQLVLITQPGVTLDDVRAAHPTLSLTDLRRYSPARIHLVGVPAGQEAQYELELAADIERLRVAEQNKTVASAEQGTTQSLFLRTAAGNYRTQQALADINALTPPPPLTAPRGTLVAVLDTGVAPHPDLVSRLDPGGYNFIADTTQADESGCGQGSGLVGHGTHTAGVITLVDPDARVLPVTVLGCDGVGNAFAVASGIYHAIESGAGVINMSFATLVASNAVERALEDADAAGVTCISAVSNSGSDTRNARVYPAEFDQVIGVGGLERVNGLWRRASFSDWGRSLDISAPAVNIRSMWYDGAAFGYAEGSGTSFAAAMMSGVASMVRAKYGPRDVLWMQARLCAASRIVDVGVPYGMGCGHREDGLAPVIDAGAAVCAADMNADEFVDFFDYTAYVEAFETGASAADSNRDGFIDFFDYDAYLAAFESGC
jgi:hypothetical protein